MIKFVLQNPVWFLSFKLVIIDYLRFFEFKFFYVMLKDRLTEEIKKKHNIRELKNFLNKILACFCGDVFRRNKKFDAVSEYLS